MSDVVIKLSVKTDAEAHLFGSFLSKFLESRGAEAELWGSDNDAPFVMVHSDPNAGVEMKVVTFQERHMARDFSRGWAEALVGLTGKAWPAE
jgi:hypothetical protein